jgi:integrase
MSNRKLPSGHYQIDFKLKGMPRYRRVHTEARSGRDADVIENKLKHLAFERKWRPRFGEELFEDFALNTYMPAAKVEKSSWEYDLLFIRQAIPHFRGKSLIEITPEDIRRFRDKRAADETRPGKLRAKGTVKREMNMLARIFNYAIEIDRLQVNPCKKVKTPSAQNAKTCIVSRDEEKRILEVLREEAYYAVPLVELALETGMRRGELLKFCPRHLDLEIRQDLKGNVLSWGEINLPGHICKSKKPRSIPMSEKARSILLGAIQNRDPERPIFRGYGFSLNNISNVFTAACRKLGIEEVTFHTLRHTFGTRLAQAGTHQATIKDILGHASLQQTDVYVHPDREMKQRAIQALSDLHTAEVVRIEKTG